MKSRMTAFFIFLSITVFGQGWSTMGGRSMSMANASVTLKDVWGYHNNPGVLGTIDQLSIGISYENRFLLKELQNQGVAAVIPLKVGVLSVGGQLYGYKQFRSYNSGLGYSMKLSENFFAGVQMNYQGLRFAENYGSKNTITAAAGVYANITEDWTLGMSIYNLGRSKLSDFQDDRFSSVMRLGTSYRFSDKVLVALEAEKDIEYDVRVKTGIEYQLIDDFYLRGGVATSPIEITFGAGYKFKFIQLSLGSAYHQTLGWSPHFSIVYQGK
ncbi:MAG: hypothetical protein MK066_09455 [Crocinitomicaceae bacterium]|nr:hypothetical protein [Crocinitomicaceae bacterium]